MNTPSILLTIQGGKIVGATANGKVNLYIELADTLEGVRQVPVHEITNAEFEALIQGRIPETE